MMMMMMNTQPVAERWLPCPGFELYEVSSFGRVRRTVTLTGKPSGRILKQSPNMDGRLHVTLTRRIKKRSTGHTTYVHKMVAKAFVPNTIGPGAEVHHQDDCQTHNHASNLKWMTKAEHDALHATRGADNAQAKLTAAQVADIRSRCRPYSKDCGTRALAKQFGVSQATVSCVVRGVKYVAA
jgi:hypothetical protein